MSEPMFSEVYRAYLLAQQARGLDPRYRRQQERVQRMFLACHGDLPLADLRAEHIRTWLLWLRGEHLQAARQPEQVMAGAGANQYLRLIRAFCNWAESEEYVLKAPTRSVKPLKADHALPDVLTEAEVLSLLQQVKGDGDRNSFRDYCILLMFVDTGLRVAELAGLQLPQLNLEAGYAKVKGKGRKERIVPLGIQLRGELAKYTIKYRKAAAGGSPALFINEHGLPLEISGIQTMVKRALQQYVARPLRRPGPHLLRHTFATISLRAEHNIKKTSLIMGHSSVAITERYLHLTGDDVLIDPGGSHMDHVMRNGK